MLATFTTCLSVPIVYSLLRKKPGRFRQQDRGRRARGRNRVSRPGAATIVRVRANVPGQRQHGIAVTRRDRGSQAAARHPGARARRARARRPSAGTLLALGLTAAVVVGVAFFAGYLPRQKRETQLVADAKTEGETAPLVNVTTVERSSANRNWCCRATFRPSRKRPSWRAPADTSGPARRISATA